MKMLDQTQRKTHMLFALLVLPLVAGFDLTEDSPIEAAASPPIQNKFLENELSEIDFHRSLAAAYFDLSAQSAHSIQDQQIFVRKALSAQNGETPNPAYLGEWVLTERQHAILAAARKRLMTHLALTPDATSKAAALANFDCWVAHAEQTVFAAHTSHCRDAFERAVGIAPHEFETTLSTVRIPEEADNASS